MEANRRDFLKKSAILCLSGLAGSLIAEDKLESIDVISRYTEGQPTSFFLPPLPYAFDAMEPFIDKQTMEIHYSKHHRAYVDKLNGADLSVLNLKASDEMKCRSIGPSTPSIIRNNMGGHYNHSLFWVLLTPNPQAKLNEPKGALSESIKTYFRTFDDFKKEFSDKALKLFGSGWCWLIIDENKKLVITTSANQDNPLMQDAPIKGKPILALDVWEHAYYLKYQNKRIDYITNWWNLINWEMAEKLFNSK